MANLSKMDRRKQQRLYEQLDFFGAKKKRFVSVYANKPRIRMRGKQRSYTHSKAETDDTLLRIRLTQEASRRQAQQASASGMPYGSSAGMANGQSVVIGGLGGLGHGNINISGNTVSSGLVQFQQFR